MPGHEDGEYELILGNKQLLGVLFIIIVLLGVFFAMGFLAGRGTAPETANAKRPAESELVRIDPRDEPKQVAKAKTEPPPVVVVEGQKVSPAPTVEQPPAKQAAPATKSTPPAPTAQAPDMTRTQQAASVDQLPAPPAGMYLQVAATTLRDAQAMLGLLKKNGHQGALEPVPNRPELVRVLVGPVATKESLAEARESVRQLGIENPMPRTIK